MQMISKQSPRVGYFERQQVVKGPPIPVRERMSVCSTVKSYHPVSLFPPHSLCVCLDCISSQNSAAL